MSCTVFLLLKVLLLCRQRVQEAEIWALEAVRLLSSKNLDFLLDLFEDDAVVYEPFSKEGVLNGLGEIAPFLKVVCNNPSFLFSKESTKITYMKYAPSNMPGVRVATEGPTNCLLDFEFGESSVRIKEKTVRKIKKLRIDTRVDMNQGDS